MSQTTETKPAGVLESAATDVEQFISELDAGLFERMLSIALSQCAASTCDHDKTSEVTVKFKFEKIAGTSQVFCSHALKFSKPTMDGKAGEETGRKTVLHVGKFGKLTISPESQIDMFIAGKKPTHQ